MELAVFQEFGESAVLKAASEFVKIDQAPEPHTLVKTDEEKHIVTTNAKLFFPSQTAAGEVDAVLEKLVGLGFTVVLRNPVTSAGCAMTDRVILRHGPAYVPPPPAEASA